MFSKLSLPEKYDTVHVKHLIPLKNETLKSYAKRFSLQIDTTQKFSVIGVSLGGMVATELADILNPEQVIIVSSAKCNTELPRRYTFMKRLPIYQIIPPLIYKLGSYIAQPVVEPDRKKEKEVFVAMLHDKNPVFLKRATKMIVNWKKEHYSHKITHIHGTNDHTLPYRNIKADFTVKNGSHMMMLTKSNEINALIINILNSK
ncbi:MAG: alpha/beta hydrolase [Chlorobi bacterium]|nr:alpha/beta hydrolase [Chlorobiota bacterium]